jgi:hypothetical protein
MGPEFIRLGMRLEAISLHQSVRILHHLLLHTDSRTNAFRTCSCPLCGSTLGRYDDPKISFPILPNCVGDSRPRDTAHHNYRDGLSRGLGYAIAEELGFSGAKIVVDYVHSKGPVEELVAKLQAGGSPEAVALQADVSDPEQAAILSRRQLNGLAASTCWSTMRE